MDAADVQTPDVADSIYALGTLKVHYVERINTETINLFFNSTFKQNSDILKSLHCPESLQIEEYPDSESGTEPETVNELEPENALSAITDESIQFDDVKEGDWVQVIYEEERFLGKILKKQVNEIQVRCLEKPYGIREPQEFEREEDAIFYQHVYPPCVQPKLIQKGRKWLWLY